MTLRQATALGIRLIGLSILAQIVIALPQIVMYAIYLSGPGGVDIAMESGGISGVLFQFAGSILMGLILVFGATPISGWVFTDADPERRTPAIDGGRFFTWGIALVGLAVAALSLPDLVGATMEARAMDQHSPDNVAMGPILVQILKIVIGVVLVRQAPAIARSIGKSWNDPEVDEAAFD